MNKNMKPININRFACNNNLRGKRIGKSKYKYVSIYENKGSCGFVFQAYIPKFSWSKYFYDEREAGKAVDLKMIEMNHEPVNILKRL